MGDIAQAWVRDAECRGVPVNLFFTAATEDEALDYCKRCPVRRQCLADALIEEASAPVGRWGVRGGKMAKERQRLQRQRGRVESASNNR